MIGRREVLAASAIASLCELISAPEALTEDCGSAAGVQDIGNALLDRYTAAINAHDTSSFPELFTEGYIQHSGRSASGLAAQIQNFRGIFTSMPDIQFRIEDRIIVGDKAVARATYSATHSQPIRDIAPTGKAFTFRTIDIWRIENGKFAEHWDLSDLAEVLSKLRGG
jgi:predicted ester cyclase